MSDYEQGIPLTNSANRLENSTRACEHEAWTPPLTPANPQGKAIAQPGIWNVWTARV